MKQQINLFSPTLLGSTDRFSSTRLLAVLCAGVLLLTLYGTWQQWRWHSGQSQLSTLQHAVEQLQTEVAQRSGELAERQDTAALEQRLARLEEEYRAKQHLLAQVTGRDIGNLDGFSEQLAGLGRHPPEDLWLRAIHLAKGGNEMLLEGSTLDGERVPRYLQALADEPWFAGTLFSTLALQRSESEPAQLDFVLITPCHDRDGQRLGTEECSRRIRRATRP